MNMDRPTVSKTRASAPTATVSSGRFSVKTWAMNCLPVSVLSQHREGVDETHGWCRASHEHQATHVRSALVAQGTGGIEQRTDTV